MRAPVTAAVAALALALTGCAVKAEGGSPAKPHHEKKAAETISAGDISTELPKLFRTYAISSRRESVSLFGIPGQKSLNEAVEKAVLEDLKAGGAFGKKKGFQPPLTKPEKRREAADFMGAPKLEGESETASASSSVPVTIANGVVAAGGDFIITEVASLIKGEKTTHQFVTNTAEDKTVPASELAKDSASLEVTKDGLRIDGNDAGDDKLSDLGREVKESLGQGLTIEKKKNLDPDFSCGLLPCAAITYDDGPADAALTKRLHDALDDAQVRATFFDIGRSVKTYSKEAKVMADAGHEVENHSFTHPVLPSLPAAKQKSQIDTTDAAINDAVGATPTMIRPPYGASSRQLGQVTGQKGTSPAKAGKAIIQWDVDTLDWKIRNADHVRQAAVQSAVPGSIILMHAIHATTIDATPQMLKELKAKGLYPVSVGFLFHDLGLHSGGEYYCRGYLKPLCSNIEHPYVTKNK